jgi:hypothetical protein
MTVAGAPVGTSTPDVPGERRPFRDNPRLIITALALLVGSLVALVIFAGQQPTELDPDFLGEVVLNALVFVDFTLVCVFDAVSGLVSPPETAEGASVYVPEPGADGPRS